MAECEGQSGTEKVEVVPSVTVGDDVGAMVDFGKVRWIAGV